MNEIAVIDTSRAITLTEAARDYRGTTPAMLRQWIRDGDLPAFRYRPRGPWRVMPEDVADLIEHNRPRTARRTR
jgi:hypothetical protein